jgi:hypothetical protein
MTLSDFIDKYGPAACPTLLKLDVQGAELAIILRASPAGTLVATGSRHAGRSRSSPNSMQGQPLFGGGRCPSCEAQGFMSCSTCCRSAPIASRASVSHAQCCAATSTSGQESAATFHWRLIAADALYLRPPEAVLASGDQAAILKLFVILLLYRFLDEALWLVESARKAGHLSASDEGQLIDLVKSAAPKPGLLQRADWLGKLARKISRKTGIGHGRKIDYWLDRSWDF